MINSYVQSTFNELSKRSRRSLTLHIFINVSIILSSALLVVLNLYMVRMNPGNTQVRWIFIFIAISSATSGALSSFLTLKVYRKRSKNHRIKYHKLSDELKRYDEAEGEYNKKDRDEVLLKNIHDILRND